MKRVTRTWTYTAYLADEPAADPTIVGTVFMEAYTQGDGETRDEVEDVPRAPRDTPRVEP